MKRRKVTVAVLSVVLAAAALTGCGSAQQTNGPKKTRVVLNEVAHSIFYAPMYVAIEEGYFEDAGIDLELVTGFGADKTMTAVLTGEADIGFMGSESTIYTYAGGTEDYVVNFAQLTQRAGNFLRTMLLYVIHAFLQGISECLNGLGIFFQVTLLC